MFGVPTVEESNLPGILDRSNSAHSGRSDSPDEADETRSSEESAFGLVGNETRAEIIGRLGTQSLTRDRNAVVSFSDLREAVDSEMGSSQFNYHL